MPFAIDDGSKALEASNAIRDILFLYRDLISYGGFVGDHDTGSFKHWRFLDCEGRGGWPTMTT